MISAPQEILLDEDGALGTQSLILDQAEGRPSAITSVSVWPVDADDTTDAESATTGSASVETNPNTTISAAAGPSTNNPVTLTLTAGTGVARERVYRLTEDGLGYFEDVETAAVSGTSVTLRNPLRNEYSAGSTFVSLRSSIALSSTWLADQSNLSPLWRPTAYWRVRWVVTINSTVRVFVRYFDVLRYSTNLGLTAMDMDRRFPGWLDRLGPDDQMDQGRRLFRRAYEEVRAEFRGDGKNHASLRDEEIRTGLVMTKANLNAIEDQVFRGADVGNAYELAVQKWRQSYDQHIRAPVAPVDTAGGGASTVNRETPLTVR